MSSDSWRIDFTTLRDHLGEYLALAEAGDEVIITDGRSKIGRVQMVAAPEALRLAAATVREEATAIAQAYLHAAETDDPPVALTPGTSVDSEVDRLVAEHADMDSLRNRRRSR